MLASRAPHAVSPPPPPSSCKCSGNLHPRTLPGPSLHRQPPLIRRTSLCSRRKHDDDEAARSLDDDVSPLPPKTLGALTADNLELHLAYQSESDNAIALMQQVVKTTGLHRAPLSGGVRSATLRYDLPSPPVAVRNLVEIANYGHLCTIMSGMHHRRAGYPFGTVIDFAADGAGNPIFCLSPLAIHSRNVLQDPRCSLVVQMPGWTGLANARVTIFGDVYQLPADMQAAAQKIFMDKHGGNDRWLSGNFVYFRMSRIIDIYFVGGFGTVQWISPEEYHSSCPDDIVLDNPTKTLQVLTEAYGAELQGPMSMKIGETVSEVQFVSIDANGADIRVRTGQEFNVQRIGFPSKVHTLEQALGSLDNVVATMKRMSSSPTVPEGSTAASL